MISKCIIGVHFESVGGGGDIPIWAIGMIIATVIALGLLIAVVLLVRR